MNKSSVDYTKMPAAERIRLIEQIYISYPRLDAVMRTMEHCHQFSKVSAEPTNMLVVGETGMGKTTAIKRYGQKFPRRETRNGTMVIVLTASVPVPATVKSLVTHLLDKLGDPMADRGTVVNQTQRLQKLLKACGVELILLDEFQHFIERDSLKVLKNVADWLKVLLNETGIPIVLIGLPSSDQVLEANPQLKRRFSLRASLEPFDWETPEQQRDLRKFLKVLDEKLPLLKRSHLADEETAYRFFCATGGVIAHLMQLTRRAAALAVARSMARLDLDVLAEAYDELLALTNTKMNNPFLS